MLSFSCANSNLLIGKQALKKKMPSIIIFLISSEKCCVNLFSLLLYICQHNIYIILPCNLVVPHCPHTKKTFTNLCCKRKIVRNHLFFFSSKRFFIPLTFTMGSIFQVSFFPLPLVFVPCHNLPPHVMTSTFPNGTKGWVPLKIKGHQVGNFIF